MREELDIVAAYQLVGTYRGAAEICGTTHKTVKRVIERTRRHRPPKAPARPTTPVRTAASGGWSRRKAAVPPRARPWPAASGVVPGRAPRDRLGRDRRGARLLRRARLVPGPVRAVRRGREAGHDAAVLAECFKDLGGVPKVVLADRMNCLKGGVGGGRSTASCPPRSTSGSPRTTGSGGLLRGARPAVQRSGGERRRARQGRPDAAAAARARPAGRRRYRRILCGVKGIGRPSCGERAWCARGQRERAQSMRPSARPHRRPRRSAHP